MGTHAGELEGFEKWCNDEKTIASTSMTHPARQKNKNNNAELTKTQQKRKLQIQKHKERS